MAGRFLTRPGRSRERAMPLYVAEPPPSFLVRPPLVVDCSVLSAVLFEEPMRDTALRQLAGRTLHAPSLLDHEIANVVVKKQRQKWPADSLDMAMADYAEHDIALHRVDLGGQVELALRYGLSAYDAAYLWLAAELKAPLATFDHELGAAATQHLGQLE